MSDLEQPLLEKVGREFFERARFDATVGGPSRVEEVQRWLVESGNPDYRFFGQVMGMLFAEACGLPPPVKSPTTIARYRALAGKWELSAGDMAGRTATSPVALDYGSGRVRAA